MEKMLIETDSPFLSPDPLRGKSNEPANVKIVAESIALIKGITIDKVSSLTTNNFNKLFFNE
jgi:TatD DNase family protein